MNRLLSLLAFALFVFLWAPLLFVFSKGAHISAFEALWNRSDLLQAFMQSLLLALGASFVSTLLAAVSAFALPNLSPRALRWAYLSLLLPMLLPEIVFGLSYLVWFLKLGLELGWTTLLLGHVAFSFSYAVLILKASVEKLEWSRVDAARDLGASRWKVFQHALLPQLAPGLTAAALSVFSLSLDDYFISSFLKGVDQMTLPIQIFSMMRVRIGPEVYALAVVLFCLSLLSVLSSRLWLENS